MQYSFITIEGNIGAGKTTLAKMLAEDLQANLILEQFSNNPFLPSFYKNPEQNAFPLELFFMAERYQQLQKIAQQQLFQNQTISDYLFSKSQLFASTNLTENELQLYMRLFGIINKQLPKPDLIVYLHQTVEQLQSNIQKRGREYEQNISADYLLKIEQAYFSHFKQIKDVAKIVVINAEAIDFVHREIDYLRIKKIIQKEYARGITLL